MNSNFFNFNIIEVGLFFVAIGYVITFWKKGGNEAMTEVISALKEQHSINVTRIVELTKQLGELKGQMDEKDKRIDLLESMVKTTPEQKLYMDDMRKFTQGVAEYMAGSTKTMGEISVYMHQLNNPIVEKVV